MTFIEFLLVLVVFAVILWMIIPFRGKPEPPTSRTRIEIQNLSAAISQYETVYGHLLLMDSLTVEDITLGLSPTDRIVGARSAATNADLMVVLMDIDLGANAGHKLNPRKIQFFESKMVSDVKSPGFSIVDHQFRDPWGNPYIISLDANDDGYVRDACYGSPVVSSNADLVLINRGRAYEFRGSVMVWSRGPDGKASMAVPANKGVNKDNVLGWR
jgi:hypothetical protein